MNSIVDATLVPSIHNLLGVGFGGVKRSQHPLGMEGLEGRDTEINSWGWLVAITIKSSLQLLVVWGRRPLTDHTLKQTTAIIIVDLQ